MHEMRHEMRHLLFQLYYECLDCLSEHSIAGNSIYILLPAPPHNYVAPKGKLVSTLLNRYLGSY